MKTVDEILKIVAEFNLLDQSILCDEIHTALDEYQKEIARLNTIIESKPSAKMMNTLSQKTRELTDENESLNDKILNMKSLWEIRTQVMNDLIAENDKLKEAAKETQTPF